MFHLTKKKYLPSILAHGLLPDRKSGITVKGRDKHHKVFLTNDIQNIIYTQAGLDWCKKNDIIVLEIDMTDIKYEPHRYYCSGTYTESDFEFTTDKISAEKIKDHLSYIHFLYENTNGIRIKIKTIQDLQRYGSKI